MSSTLALGALAAAAAAAAVYLLTRKPTVSAPLVSAPHPSTSASSMPIVSVPGAAAAYRIPTFYPQAAVLQKTKASSPWLKASMMSWASDNAGPQMTASVGPGAGSGDGWSPDAAADGSASFSVNSDGSASASAEFDGSASFSGDPVISRYLHRRRKSARALGR